MYFRRRFGGGRRTAAVLAALVMTVAGCGGSEDSESGQVTIRYSWWGNADRAALVQQAIDLFQRKNPTIKVTPSFQEYEAYWQKISTEVAGGGAPDVLQMDISFLRQYADRGVLLDLGTQSENLRTNDFRQGLGETGKVDGKLVAVPASGNTWGLVYDPEAFERAGVPAPKSGWTFDNYHEAVETISKSGGKMKGGTDYAGIIYALEMQLRQQGGGLYTQDGKLGFTKDRLRQFWNSTAQLRDGETTLSPRVAEQIQPATATGRDLVASEFIWDNFFVRYAGETKRKLALAPVPSLDPNRLGQYLKASMLMSASARTEHPAEAAKLIDFFVNDPEAGKILGANRGVPASNAQLKAAELAGPDAAVLEYEQTLADQLQQAPSAPPAGAGTIEAAFLRIHGDIAFGRTTVDEAVDQFFTEAEQALAS